MIEKLFRATAWLARRYEDGWEIAYLEWLPLRGLSLALWPIYVKTHQGR